MSTDTIRTIWDGHLDFHTAPELCVNTDSRSMLLYVHTAPEFCEFKFEFNQCCFTSTETIVRTTRDWEPRTATSTFTQLLSSVDKVQVQCCFTSTETIRTIRYREPRTAISTFTQLLHGSAESG